MYVVDGVLKEYAWGRVDGLVPWHRATGGPQAELWFGAHPAGPAPLSADPTRTLAQIDDLESLPLVKLLAAGQPLSIQVHPDAQRAAAGFTAQRDDPALPVLFADAAEKSEVLIALTDFDTHAGWREPARALQVLVAAGLPDDLRPVMAAPDRVAAIRALLDLDVSIQQSMIERLIPAAVSARWHPDEIAALDRIAAAFPGDRGILVTTLLAHHRVAPGQAIAVPAGVVHSYVHGLGVEVMTSSDNVLRLGLTSKPIAIDEALAAIRPDREPRLFDRIDDVSGLPFSVAIASDNQAISAASGQARIIVSLSGTTTVNAQDLPVGQAMVLTPDDIDAQIVTTGQAVIVGGDQLPG